MTANHVRSELHGVVCVVAFDHPNRNCFSHSLRSALVDALDRAAVDNAVRAIVLVGSQAAFSVGADIREFGTRGAETEPTLRTLIEVVEQSPKPVVAALSGHCLGGGLELALACHFRVALADAMLGLPEIHLGLIPGAGGTQRLPRLIGVEQALGLMLSGTSVAATRFAGTPLLDAVVADSLLTAALEFATRVIEERRPAALARDRALRVPNADAFFQFAAAMLSSLSKSGTAAAKCIETVQTAVTKPFVEGLALERKCFEELVASSESKAIRHIFLAERMATKVPGISSSTAVRSVARVGIVGAGTMGGGIATTFLSAGIPTVLVESTREALDRGVATITRNYEDAVKKRRLTEVDAQRALKLLEPTLDYALLRDCDLDIEAVYEDLGVKAHVMRVVDEVAKAGAILATNTSTLNVDVIANFTRRPRDVLGMHFFSPAHVMKLLEVVRGAATGDDVLATVMALSKKINKTAVVSAVCDGFIGNRMLQAYLRQAFFLLEEGALPSQIDEALERFGMAMGPFRVGDLAGNDIGWAIRKRLRQERPEVKYSPLPDLLCELGRFGQKVGKGWYRYASGSRRPEVDPEVTRLVESFRIDRGVVARTIAEEEIVQRCVFALVNEGARVVQDGVALRASDIDLVYLNGYGFPRRRGGPMFYADTVGLYRVARAMWRFAAGAQADAQFWTPAPLVVHLAAEGGTFCGAALS